MDNVRVNLDIKKIHKASVKGSVEQDFGTDSNVCSVNREPLED